MEKRLCPYELEYLNTADAAMVCVIRFNYMTIVKCVLKGDSTKWQLPIITQGSAVLSVTLDWNFLKKLHAEIQEA